MIGVLHIYRKEDIIQQNTSMCIYQIKLLLPPGVLYYCHWMSNQLQVKYIYIHISNICP